MSDEADVYALDALDALDADAESLVDAVSAVSVLVLELSRGPVEASVEAPVSYTHLTLPTILLV